MGGSVCFAVKKGDEIRSFVVDTGMLKVLSGYPLFEEANHDQLQEKYAKHLSPTELAPVGYGLVAVDVDQKWIGDMQDYTSVGGFNYFPSIDRNSSKHKDIQSIWEQKLFDQFVVLTLLDGPKELFRKDFQSETLEAFIEEIPKKLNDRPINGIIGNLILSDWTVQKIENILPFFESLIDRAWNFSGRDLEAWLDFSKDHEDDFDPHRYLAEKQQQQLNQSTPHVCMGLKRSRI